MASFSVYRAEFRDGSAEMWSQKETIASGPCTPLPTLEMFSKKISSSTRSSIEIAGLLKKKLMMNNYDRDSRNAVLADSRAQA